MGTYDEAVIDRIAQSVIHQLRVRVTKAIPVGVSARHVHLTREHVEALFGEGYTLTPIKTLMGGQFAAQEQVTIIGAKLKAIENVRILGPVRRFSQVELATTDAFRLGIRPPVRDSGDIAGSAPIGIAGPKGVIYLNEGCIIAARHIHMPPVDAEAFGVGNGETVRVRYGGERGGIMENVLVRVDESYTLEFHIDTDEGNCFSIKTGDTVTLEAR